jgi:hypothetical protein
MSETRSAGRAVGQGRLAAVTLPGRKAFPAKPVLEEAAFATGGGLLVGAEIRPACPSETHPAGGLSLR